MGQPVFASGQKNWAQVRLGQKILTCFAMSNFIPFHSLRVKER